MKKLKALGFIEVLIALVVAGIVSSVFLSIAGNSMKDLILTERIEYMARLAKDGFNVAQEVANQEKANIVTSNDNNYFPDVAGFCYIPTRTLQGSGEDVQYGFEKEGGGEIFVKYDNRKEIVSHVIESPISDTYLGGDEYFVVMCIQSIDESSSQWANVYFWVGDPKLQGEVTNDSDVKDFIYYSVIEL